MCVCVCARARIVKENPESNSSSQYGRGLCAHGGPPSGGYSHIPPTGAACLGIQVKHLGGNCCRSADSMLLLQQRKLSISRLQGA